MDGENVGVIESGDRLGFALEACHALGVTGQLLWEYLDRDITLESSVMSAIDDSHAAGADLVDDPVAPKHAADELGHMATPREPILAHSWGRSLSRWL